MSVRRLGGLIGFRRHLLLAWFALRDREASLVSRVMALAVVAYVLSPFDLIPDVIPLLGWLDDLGILRLGLWLLFKLYPEPVLQRAALRADAADAKAKRWTAYVLLGLGLWLLMLTGLCAWLLWVLVHP